MRRRNNFHPPNSAPVSGGSGTPIRVLWRG